MPDQEELGRFLVRRALAAYGLATEREIQDHLHAASKPVISTALTALVDAGDVLCLNVEGIDNRDYYAQPEAIEKVSSLKATPAQVHLLSPFDNLIIQRERTRRLFDFDYSLECYTPAAKRKYGYFVLPILWGERLIGRLDPKADRKEKTLILRNLVFEPEFEAFDAVLPALAAKLRSFVRFNQCERLKVERVSPEQIKGPLVQLTKG